MNLITKLFSRPINIHNLNLKITREKSNTAELANIKSSIPKVNRSHNIQNLIKKNKIVSFVVIFLTVHAILSFKPAHLDRPEILARNRLEKRLTK